MKLTASMIRVSVFIFLSGFGISLSNKTEIIPPRVDTPLGVIEGYYKTSGYGRTYEAFEGIPYARPPTGESRFRVSRGVSSWTGVFMAKKFGPKCMQYDNRKVEGSEDCLYLNVYTPITNDAYNPANASRIDLLPVIFFIHGGAFYLGSAMEYKSEYLLDRNVTLVTLNYRLGPLGFLSTEDEVVPGNMGLKDQVIALRWVKDNIRSFGGDPSRITIFGQSSGGTSVHYHYLTNLTTGLFQGGMSLSGTALNSLAQTENSLEKAKELSKIVGCPTESVQSMIDCLRHRPAHQIVEAIGKFVDTPALRALVPFGPVVEKTTDEFTFIDRSPIEIINSGDVKDLPWITGVTNAEGLIEMGLRIANDSLLKELNDDWETIAPNLLDFKYTVPKSDHREVARLIKERYFGTSPISRSTINQTVQMVNDRLFFYHAEEAARLQAQVNRSPVRFYYFSYRGAHSLTEYLTGSSENFGACHGDDLIYLLGFLFDPMTTPEDRDVQKKLIDLWVSFATDGAPNAGIEWPKMSRSAKEFRYLNIAGAEDFIATENSSDFGGNNFWHGIGLQENIYQSVNREIVAERGNSNSTETTNLKI